MGDFNVRFDLSKFKDLFDRVSELKAPIDKKTADAIGQALVGEVRSDIAKGISPIEGRGNFPAYKNPKSYPGKRKPAEPVNLNLTGKFQKSLKATSYKTSSGYGVEIGYSSSQEIKEQGHREGAKGQPFRPSLPSHGGEDFTTRIRQIIYDFYESRIRSFFK